MLGSQGNDLLTGGKGNDKLFAGFGYTIMKGESGANHFLLSMFGFARAMVLDHNPDIEDTIGGQYNIVNTIVGNDTGAKHVPKIELPD